MYIVGKVLNTHGIKGEVKVKQITDFSDRFQIGETLYVMDKYGRMHSLKIDGCRTQKNNLLLHFEGYDSIEDVDPLKNLELTIKEEQQTELDPGEYYYHEIIDCQVITTTEEEIGIIESILSPGANDVWVVRGENNKEILIPYIEDVVKKVDIENKKVTIERMEGLIE